MQTSRGKLYFCGIFEDRSDDNGVYGYIEWDWNICRDQATMLTSADVWNLHSAARKQYTQQIEVERAYTVGDVRRILKYEET